MGTSTLTVLLIHLSIFLGCLMPVVPDPISDLVCQFVNCGQGNCTESKGSLIPFDCQCNAGWKKVKLGVLVLPPCVLPDCDLDFGCSSRSISLPPEFNVTDPCSYTYCGDGTCLAQDETNYTCNCNEGSENLLNSTSLPCLNQCVLQNCKSLGGSQSPLPSPLSPPILPPFSVPPKASNATESGDKGSMEYSSSKKYQVPALILFFYIVIFHALGLRM